MITAYDEARLIRRIRITLTCFIVGLVLSGATAIPIQWQLDLLSRRAGLSSDPSIYSAESWQHWLVTVHAAVTEMSARYPFMGYAGDWLAFGHFMIALVFLWAWRRPVRYRFLFDYGLLLCLCVIPYALIFGHFRGIPMWWRAIDSSFGLLGAIPLALCRRWSSQLAEK